MKLQYLGGKSRIAKQLAEVIDSIRHPGQLVWDAFCGGLSMSVALRKKGPVWSTDACVPLISLYRAVQSGWDPPHVVTVDEYNAAKALPDTDPMKAFCAVCCSFSGKWFGGYARSSRPDRVNGYAHGGRKQIMAQVPSGSFAHVDFLTVQPQPCEAILYLDPPYAGTTGYDGAAPFDSKAFVQRVHEWSRFTHVFVSEYSFPIGECVWSKAQTTTVSRDKSRYSQAVERLYYVGPTTVLP